MLLLSGFLFVEFFGDFIVETDFGFGEFSDAGATQGFLVGLLFGMVLMSTVFVVWWSIMSVWFLY